MFKTYSRYVYGGVDDMCILCVYFAQHYLHFNSQPFGSTPGNTPSTSQATTVEHGVVPGELVVLGTEGICGQAGMARGVVRIMTDTYITVETNKPIPDRWCGMGGGVGGATIGMEAHGGIKEEENKGEHMTWRIDRDAIASTFVRMRSNLLALCKGNDLRTRRLRTLLVHGAAPAAPAVVSSLV